jgi:hypothetical protein
LSVSGKTITYTRGNGNTGTITTQDTTYTASTISGIKINGTTILHSTDAGYKHLPAAGSTNQYVVWKSAGTGQWENIFGKTSGSSGVILGTNLTENTLNTYGGGNSAVIGQNNTISGAVQCGFAFGQNNTMTDTTSESTVEGGSYSRFNFFTGYSNSFGSSSGRGTGCFAAGLLNKVQCYTAGLAYVTSTSADYDDEKQRMGSVALGVRNTAGSGFYAGITLGYGNTAYGNGYSTAIGLNNSVPYNYSYCIGRNNTHSGILSNSFGGYLNAQYGQTILGHYNNDTASSSVAASSIGATSGSVLQVGWGTSTSNRKNLFNLQGSGTLWITGEYKTAGADYAEYFEWSDGNPENEDRRGKFVTFDSDEKIRLATAEDDYILGIVSAFPSIVGDSHEEDWKGRYLKDVFGAYIIEEREVPAEIDEISGETIMPATKAPFMVENPEYNRDEKYIPRKDRSEWSPIGMMGKLVVIDDGSCEVNGYASVRVDGIATKGTRANGYRVVARLDDTHIKVIFK